MTIKELQKEQTMFATWLKTQKGVHTTGIRNNSSGVLSIYHTTELSVYGKKEIATELGGIPLMFEQTEPGKVKGAWEIKKLY